MIIELEVHKVVNIPWNGKDDRHPACSQYRGRIIVVGWGYKFCFVVWFYYQLYNVSLNIYVS